MNMLSEKQTHLFKQLGIDLEKIKVECHKMPEERTDIKVKEIFEISFLICGKLLSITLFQAEVYGSEDVFGKDDRSSNIPVSKGTGGSNLFYGKIQRGNLNTVVTSGIAGVK